MPRVGVLEFIDHGHRVLSAYGVGEFALVAVQGLVQPLQQVVEIEHRLVQLGLLVGLSHRVRRVFDQLFFAVRFAFSKSHHFAYAVEHIKICRLGPAVFLQFFSREAF